MFINFRFNKYCRSLALFVPAIAIGATLAFSPQIPTNASGNPMAQLPAQEQAALRSGDAVLTGQKGQYTCRVLVAAPVATIWKVLTDYENFENFYPNVISSEVIENNGNRKVFEQIYEIQALVFTKQERVRIAATETYPQQIEFNLVEGDVSSLTGTWKLEPVSSNQVLITHQVSVDPGSDDPIFFGIYEDSLESLLAAVKQESEQHAALK
jgi:ribosome-associated toxin RatA of RatAB toxin-antitoxin module